MHPSTAKHLRKFKLWKTPSLTMLALALVGLAAMLSSATVDANTPVTDTAGIKGKTMLVKSSAGGCLTVKESYPYSYAQVHTDDCGATDKSPDLRGQQWIVAQETDSSSVMAGNYQLQSALNEDMCLSTFGIFNDTTNNSSLQPRLSRCTDDDRTQWFKLTAEGSDTPQKYSLAFEGWNPSSMPIPGAASTGYTGGRWHKVQLFGPTGTEGDAHFKDAPTGTDTTPARAKWTFQEQRSLTGDSTAGPARAWVTSHVGTGNYIEIQIDRTKAIGTEGNAWVVRPVRASTGQTVQVTVDDTNKRLNIRFGHSGLSTSTSLAALTAAVNAISGFSVATSGGTGNWSWDSGDTLVSYNDTKFQHGGHSPDGQATAQLNHPEDKDTYILVKIGTGKGEGRYGNEWKIVPQPALGEVKNTYTTNSDDSVTVTSVVQKKPTQVTADDTAKELRIRFGDDGDSTENIVDRINRISGFEVISYSGKKTLWHWWKSWASDYVKQAKFSGGYGGTGTPRSQNDPGSGGGGPSFDGQTLAVKHVTADSTACLDVSYGNAVNGQDVWTWDCNDTDAQQWTFEQRTAGGLRGLLPPGQQAGRRELLSGQPRRLLHELADGHLAVRRGRPLGGPPTSRSPSLPPATAPTTTR